MTHYSWSRIYGDAFYNNKDLIFMSLFIINIYYALSYLENNNKKNFILLCLVSAFAINSRVIGGIVIFSTLIFKIVKERKNIKKALKSVCKLTIITYLLYILLTPASWSNPILFPLEVIDFFFNFSDPFSHKIQKCLYFGKWISSENLPWHYLIVWIFITTPIIYIILSLIGFTKNVYKLIKNQFKNIDVNWLFCNIIIVFILTFVAIFRPTIYTGWRHFYFLYPIIIINATVGLKEILSKDKLKKIVIMVISINLFYIIGWMIKYHPYQYNYFSLLTKKYTTEHFETNYWLVSNNEALKYIEKNTKGKVKVYTNMVESSYILSKDIRKNIKFVKNKIDADFIIDNHKKGYKKYENEYEEYYYKEMEGYRLYTIYKKR